MASQAAVHNRRANRRAKSDWKNSADRPARSTPPIKEPQPIETALTAREQRLLDQQLAPIFPPDVDAEYRARYMELHRLGWTPPHFARDPMVAHKSRADREAWAKMQFFAVWGWWIDLGRERRRAAVIAFRQTRLAA